MVKTIKQAIKKETGAEAWRSSVLFHHSQSI